MTPADLDPRAFLTDFVMEQVEHQPMAKAVLLLRALAAETTDKALAISCRTRATEIEAVLTKQRANQAEFRLRASA